MHLIHSVYELELNNEFTTHHESRRRKATLITELHDGGVRGYGEAAVSAFYGGSIDAVRRSLDSMLPLLEGANVQNYRHLLLDARAQLAGNRAALCSLDMAVHDVVCQRLGLPLHGLLGLDPLRSPRTSMTIGLDTPDGVARRAAELRGFPIIKLKLGRQDDLEVVRRVRGETGASIRVDANGAWTLREAMKRIELLADLGVELVEQPLPPKQDHEMTELYRTSAVPLIADESSSSLEDVVRAEGRFHGVNVKLLKCGGILPALEMIGTARALGLRVMIGCMVESSVAITAAAHLAPLADYLDLDGNLLIGNDPFEGVRCNAGVLTMPAEGLRMRASHGPTELIR